MSSARNGGGFDPSRFTGASRRLGPPPEGRDLDPIVGGRLTRLKGLERAAFEAVELGAVQAERIVVAHVITGCRGAMRGRSSVLVEFRDARLASAFRRTGLVEAGRSPTTWTIARCWAEADGCAELDEAMCVEVVRELHAWFARRLKAWVVTALEAGDR